jgi:uncharacterized protein with GYD domain
MIIGIILVTGFILLIGGVFYTKTKNFRESRARNLINSSEFMNLFRLGFKNIRIDLKEIYLGEFNGYQFAVFIDPDDAMARTEFSIVFAVSYSKINDETFKRLNNEYYNRVKSLLLGSENVFFNKDYAQFRYPNSLFRIPKNKLKAKLIYISEVLKKENLEASKISDIKTLTSRNYE